MASQDRLEELELFSLEEKTGVGIEFLMKSPNTGRVVLQIPSSPPPMGACLGPLQSCLVSECPLKPA